MAENVSTEAAAATSASAPAGAVPPAAPQPLPQQLPTTSSPRAISFSRETSNPAPSSRRLSRRTSSQQQERINDILEDARERAEHLTQSPGSLSPRLQPLLGDPSRIPNYNSAGSPRHGSPRLGPAISGETTENGHNAGVLTAQPEQQHIQYSQGTHTDSTTRRRSTRASIRNLSRSSSHADPAGDPDGRLREQEESSWKKSLKYFKSIELENKGSVARDHLALERTFLAWLRTSLAFASIGIAITQLFRLNTSLADDKKQSSTLRHLGKPLGATFLGISILILFLGYNRYLESQYWVIRGKFPASRGTIILVSFIAFAVTMASLIVVVAVQRDS